MPRSGAKGDYGFPENDVMFSSKLDTDLFELAKNKTRALNLTVSPNGKFLAVFAADKKIRIFRFLSGKLYCVIDESLKHYIELQQVWERKLVDFVTQNKQSEDAYLRKNTNKIFLTQPKNRP